VNVTGAGKGTALFWADAEHVQKNAATLNRTTNIRNEVFGYTASPEVLFFFRLYKAL
jgi:hypothetical protein